MARHDPIGDKYYRPLASAETAASIIFWVAAALSIASLFVDASPWAHWLQISFLLSVVAAFILGFAIRLWLGPRAEEQRRLDLLSNSFGVKLTHENTVGYFNNNERNPVRRLALSVMESSFFTKNILEEMLRRERANVFLYFGVWLTCVLNRSTDLSVIVAGTQALFSEQVISKWLRMEYLCLRSGAVYQKLNRLIATAKGFNNSACHAQVYESFSEYEAAKSRASIGLSKRVFSRNNSRLSMEWDEVRASLNLE